MSRLDELIAALCPDGVKYKSLKEIASILRGKRLTKSELSPDALYPVYHGGLEPLGYYLKSNRPANTVMIINVGASAGTVGFCDKRFWSSDGCYCISHVDRINQKFIYYALSMKEKILMSKVRYAGIPTLDVKVVENIIIPVPPLPVQEEIVRILDKFTELTAELATELAKRKKQYQYYRNTLVDFKEGLDKPSPINELIEDLCPSSVEYIKLEEVCGFVTGFSFKSSLFKESGAPICKTTNITEGYILFKDMDCFDLSDYKEKLDKFIIRKNDIVIGMSGTIKVGISNSDNICYLNQRVGKFIPNTNILNNKFLYYFLCNAVKLMYENVSGGSVINLSNNDIKKMSIPVPPLPIQEEIVRILDRFDALCNDLTSGLPAEIEARKKQYEYYRDKLLTFKEAV